MCRSRFDLACSESVGLNVAVPDSSSSSRMNTPAHLNSGSSNSPPVRTGDRDAELLGGILALGTVIENSRLAFTWNIVASVIMAELQAVRDGEIFEGHWRLARAGGVSWIFCDG